MTCVDLRTAWEADALQQRLQAQAPGLRVQVLAEVDSTNTRLVEQARHGDAAPQLLVALEQTAGRGRQGRAWQSRAGDSLTFSLARAMAPADWSGLSLAIGVALAQALEPAPAGKPRLMVKWPNDLLLHDDATPGRKLGGILVETVAASAASRMAVVGIGLNLAAPDVPGSALGAAGLRELDGAAAGPGVLTRIAAPLFEALARFEREGFAPFRGAYARRDALAGREVTTTQADLPAGLADGVDERGALRLVVGDQGLRLVHSGEVSVRLAAARS